MYRLFTQLYSAGTLLEHPMATAVSLRLDGDQQFPSSFNSPPQPLSVSGFFFHCCCCDTHTDTHTLVHSRLDVILRAISIQLAKIAPNNLVRRWRDRQRVHAPLDRRKHHFKCGEVWK